MQKIILNRNTAVLLLEKEEQRLTCGLHNGRYSFEAVRKLLETADLLLPRKDIYIELFAYFGKSMVFISVPSPAPTGVPADLFPEYPERRTNALAGISANDFYPSVRNRENDASAQSFHSVLKKDPGKIQS